MTHKPSSHYLGIAQETAYGSLAGQVLWQFIELDGCTLAAQDDKLIQGNSALRAPDIYQPGAYACDGEIIVPVDNLVFGWFLKFLFGNVSSALAPGETQVYRHTFTPRDDLNSFQVRIGKDVFEHFFVGCMVNEIKVDVEKELAFATVSVVAQQDSKQDLVASLPVITYPGYIFSFGRATLTVDSLNASVERLSLSIKNNVDIKDTIRLDSRFAPFGNIGTREVTIDATLAFTGNDVLDRFWGGVGLTGPSSTDVLLQEVVLSFQGQPAGVTPINEDLTFTLANAAITKVSRPVQKRDRIRQDINIKALWYGSTPDVKAELVNQRTNYNTTLQYYYFGSTFAALMPIP